MNEIITGDCRGVMAGMEGESVNCCVTSPPYWGLRVYDGPQEQVWGGGPACEHDFTMDPVKGEGYTGPGRWQNRGAPTRKERPDVWSKFLPSIVGTCPKCGAWRGALGLEPNPDLYVSHLMEVMASIWRVLRKDGTCFVNIGDSYGCRASYSSGHNRKKPLDSGQRSADDARTFRDGTLRPKSLALVPFRFALACQEAGWLVRNVIIWQKPNPMPSSARDRLTVAHEYVFFLVKSERYWYDQDAIRTPLAESTLKELVMPYDGESVFNQEGTGAQNPLDIKRSILKGRVLRGRAPGHKYEDGREEFGLLAVDPLAGVKGLREAVSTGKIQTKHYFGGHKGACEEGPQPGTVYSGKQYSQDPFVGANCRTVWTFPPANSKDAHFATFPPELPRRCIRAGCPPGGIVLDPFCGTGTTCLVAHQEGRKYLGIDLSDKYVELARARLQAERERLPLLEGGLRDEH